MFICESNHPIIKSASFWAKPPPLISHFPLFLVCSRVSPSFTRVSFSFSWLLSIAHLDQTISPFTVSRQRWEEIVRGSESEWVRLSQYVVYLWSPLSIHSAASTDYFSTTRLLTFYNWITFKSIDFRNPSKLNVFSLFPSNFFSRIEIFF